MLISAIRLRHVRRFGEAGAQVTGLTGGLNVLAAPNESGKTTVVDALHACLTVPHTHRKPVETLVPDGGGNPWISLDIETPDGAFTVEKQFGQGRLAKITTSGGRVLAEAGDADDWLRAAIGADKAGQGPTGLVWVRQDASTEAPDADGARGEAVRALIGAQVSGVVGGERAQRVMRGARARLDTYVTPGRGQVAKRGPLGTAQSRVTDLEEEAVRLRAVTARTRQAAESLAQTEDDLARAEDAVAVARGREAIQAADAALAEAVRLDAGLGALRSEAARADEAAAAARRGAATLRDDQDAAQAAEAALEKAEAAAAAAEAARTDREAKAQTAEAASERAEAALRAANADLAAARRRADADRARDALKVAEARLSEARAASDALAQLGPPGPPIDLARLQTLADEATRARAQADAARATVRIEVADGLTVDGRPAEPGARLAVTEPLTLAAGGARVVIEPPRQSGVRPEVALGEAERALTDALAEAGAPGLAEARELAEAATERRRMRASQEDALSRAAPDGLAALEAEVRALTERAGPAEPAEAPDQGAAEAAREAADAAAGEARGTARAAEREAARAREAAVEAVAILTAARERAAEASERAGPRETRAATLAAREDEAARMDEAAAAARATLAKAEAALPDLAAAKDKVAALREAQENRTRRATELRERRAELAQALRTDYEGDAAEALARVEDELVAAREAEDREALELEALQLLEGTLGAAHAERLEHFLGPVTTELAPLVDAVFPGGALSLGGDLSVDALRRGERSEALETLSGGTREQLAILTKLAFARLLAKGGRRVPVVMDDALVFADDERLDRMFRAVRLAAQDCQVLALTCRAEAYEPLGGNTVALRPL